MRGISEQRQSRAEQSKQSSGRATGDEERDGDIGRRELRRDGCDS